MYEKIFDVIVVLTSNSFQLGKSMFFEMNDFEKAGGLTDWNEEGKCKRYGFVFEIAECSSL